MKKINPIITPKTGVTIYGQKPVLKMDTLNIKGHTIEEDCHEECGKCNGTGADPNFKDVRENNKCSFCNGNGKVEWLDKIYGRPKRRGFGVKWSLDAENDLKAFYGLNIEDELAKILAEEIDKEIISDILKGQ